MGTSERLVGLSPAKGWRKWGIFTTLIYKSLRAALGYVRSPMFLPTLRVNKAFSYSQRNPSGKEVQVRAV